MASDRDILIGYFVAGAQPKADQFENLIKKVAVPNDDGILKQSNGPLTIRVADKVADPAEKQEVLLFQRSGTGTPAEQQAPAVPTWSISHKTPSSTSDAQHPHLLFTPTDKTKQALLIDARVGISESLRVGGLGEPKAKLHVDGQIIITSAQNDDADAVSALKGLPANSVVLAGARMDASASVVRLFWKDEKGVAWWTSMRGQKLEDEYDVVLTDFEQKDRPTVLDLWEEWNGKKETPKEVKERLKSLPQVIRKRVTLEDAVSSRHRLVSKTNVTLHLVLHDDTQPVGPSSFDVWLMSVPSKENRAGVAGAIRGETKMLIESAYRLVDLAPSVVTQGVHRDEADKTERKLSNVGGVVEVKPQPITVEVPRFLDLPLSSQREKNAEHVAANAGLRLDRPSRAAKDDIVSTQDPDPGKKIPRGSIIKVELKKPKKPDKPSTVSKPEEKEELVESAKFDVIITGYGHGERRFVEFKLHQILNISNEQLEELEREGKGKPVIKSNVFHDEASRIALALTEAGALVEVKPHVKKKSAKKKRPAGKRR